MSLKIPPPATEQAQKAITENKRLRAENERFRDALEEIAGLKIDAGSNEAATIAHRALHI